MALVLSKMTNRWRSRGSPPASMDDYLLQTVEGAQQQRFQKMLGSLASVATLRPPGYKRKRPGHGKSKGKKT